MIRVVGVLESIVELKDNKLHGYKVVTRIISQSAEMPYRYATDRELRLKAERTVIEHVSKRINNRLFFTLPESMDLNELALINPNAVVCLHLSIGLQYMADYLKDIKRKGLKACLDDFYTADYELKELVIGAFDYVFFSESFYTNAREKDLSKAIAYFKQFGCMVGFKKLDSISKVEYALKLGADLGHGYIFGHEYMNVPLPKSDDAN